MGRVPLALVLLPLLTIVGGVRGVVLHHRG